jgi:hypothetical protein
MTHIYCICIFPDGGTIFPVISAVGSSGDKLRVAACQKNETVEGTRNSFCSLRLKPSILEIFASTIVINQIIMTEFGMPK